VWHYLKFEYLKNLLKGGSIYFPRLDKQSDKTDGMYSQVNADARTPQTEALYQQMGKVKDSGWSELQWTNDIFRKKAFVHCWSIRKKESAGMWNAFLQGNSRSVVIRSTVGKLQTSLPSFVGIVRVIYYPRDAPRPDWSYSAPFTAKDRDDFEAERELRLLVTTTIEVHEDVDHKLIPTDLKTLIGKVVLHPSADARFRDQVREELKKYLIAAPVSKSELRRSDLEAKARAEEQRSKGQK
jgi:hypothetical protein